MSADQHSPENTAARANLPFGELVVQTLDRLGVEHFVISPGSRSTPLALAVADLGPARYSVILDERSAAFNAVGRIKASRRPVALICTSGTAAAHYLPAVIEARESALPLVVLTADRPPELRHCHAGQTIPQRGLYGNFPLFEAELPLPEESAHLMRQTREICRRAIEAAMGNPHGPAHLNVPYREPFFHENESSRELSSVVKELTALLKPVEVPRPGGGYQLDLPDRTLILAGPRPWREQDAECRILSDISATRGWPVLADGANPLRHAVKKGPHVISHYDQIVRQEAFWKSLSPDAVLLWGEPPTSKILRAALTKLDVPGFQVGIGKPGMNPFHGNIRYLGGSLEGIRNLADVSESNYGAAWAKAEEAARAQMVAHFEKPHFLFEGDVHRSLARLLPEGAGIYFASSMAIRDAEWFFPESEKGFQPYSQRGANGIDGCLSIARGIAAGSGQPLYLVCGDLAFLHDANGLLGSVADNPGVFVILINNSGGGIFEFLPVADREKVFEGLFATPQSVDYEGLVRAHKGRYAKANTLDELEFALDEWQGTGLMVVEVPVDRKESARLHRRFLNPAPSTDD